MIVIAPNGTIASVATCCFDDVTRAGVFVLAGTASEHQRRGLAKGAMTEALRRLRGLGAEAAYMSSIELPAHALYASVGFDKFRLPQAWRKRFAATWPRPRIARTAGTG